MSTIRDAIDAWFNSKIRGATVITQNTEAYNHLVQATEELKAQGWAQLEIGRDMPKPTEPKEPTTQTST